MNSFIYYIYINIFCYITILFVSVIYDEQNEECAKAV
jgi:hypothetical protein